ncbi:MAG: hypothetical protein UHG68_05070 [Clostridia bacterium]|nr:hypothetical protein [Clostridia bacterium]
MSVGGEFGRRVSGDELCAEVRQAVEDGDEGALRRLGFGGFGGYVQRLSEIMSDSVTDGLDLSADDFGAIMGEVASPARYAHHLVNEAGTAIQTAKDKPLGIHIKPTEPDFDDDALKGTVGKAASMDTPEQTAATLAYGLGYAVKKAGNDFIKLNAEQRSRAGFEVSVKRSGSSKCCEWCAARIGSWALKNAPDGVFGCHANCSCTVEYTSSTGAKTSARGANLNRYGAGAFVEVEYQPPHVMTHEEAREKGGFDEPKRLTGGENGGILNLIDLSDEKLGRSIGAKAKTIWVRMPDGTEESLIEGSAITNKKIIAGKGRDRQIDIEDLLNYKHPEATPGEWVKVKGIGSLYDEYGEERKAELHWYENPTVSGKVDMKLKPRNGALYIDDD